MFVATKKVVGGDASGFGGSARLPCDVLGGRVGVCPSTTNMKCADLLHEFISKAQQLPPRRSHALANLQAIPGGRMWPPSRRT